MHNFSRRIFLCGSMFGTLATTACQLPSAGETTLPAATTAAAVAPKSAASQRLIIKFKPHTISCDAAGIARLSADTQMALEYIRPVSGNACVIRHASDREEDFAKGRTVLKQHPAVEWVEVDAVMKTM